MKKNYLLFLLVAMVGCSALKNDGVILETNSQKAAYAVGYETGKMLKDGIKAQDLYTDLDQFFAGMRAIVDDEARQYMDEEDLQRYMDFHKQRIMSKIEEEQRMISEKNEKEGIAFRENNSNRDGVVVLENGLQYEIIEVGDGGESPLASDLVTAKYKGFFLNGEVFDQSSEGGPVTFPLVRVIEGWREAFTRMNRGDKWKIVVPPELAYGQDGSPGKIEPNMTLIYEVELVDFNSPK